ncbi:MAG: Asp-tRNA(Asn)/Glu-tRNA(Gln) amidotransferase subunit GatC [Candidatus Paceibacterota bacterium]|jgi:aspartyl/glutamyl-tRNA(Asn/Gln) amidotransferase C subunit|nr:Asp-tRNA(Asn)/Glu-tRNA(Gln) amidotransferase subunit GatC [Candidatus Paceibacterota bacterium]
MDFSEINHLLELARLELTGEEKERIPKDLERILSYVEQLKEIETGEIEPINGGVLPENIFREDEAEEKKENGENASEELKKNASFLENDYFQVPPIFE